MAEKHVWNKNNQWEEGLLILKTIIAKTELVATTKWGGAIFTLNNKNVVGIGGFKSYLGIWFFNGVMLKDDTKVLVNAQEGITKNLRQWRFNSISDINETMILEYIYEAIAIEKVGLSPKPQKKTTIESPFFENKLKLDIGLAKAFEQFSPYQQKEFLEYIETAKQEKTKISRFEKIKPMISANIGLNDKYK